MVFRFVINKFECNSENTCHNKMKVKILVFLLFLISCSIFAQDDPRENFKFAKFNYDKGKYEEALKFLDKALDEDDQYINAFYLRAETYYELRQYYNAILDINHIFKIDKTINTSTGDYYLTRGKSFLAIDDYSNANNDFLKSKSYSKENPFTYYYTSQLRYETRQHIEALQELDTAINIDPNNPSFHALRAEIKIDHFDPVIGSHGYQDILSDINIAIALDDQNHKYYRIRGEFLKQMGEMEQAMEDFDSMIRLSPKEDNAYTNRGLLKMSQYEYRGAALDFTKSILLNPEMECNYRYRGLCYNNLNNLGDAYKDFSKSIEMLSVKLKDAAEAQQLRNTLGETYILRGHCLNLMGNNAQACRDFLRAHNLGLKKGLNYYRKFCGIY
jgi:tetratricopeptide (TPR) repeat protein